MNFDSDRPEGAYQVDAFFANFVPNVSFENAEDRRSHFGLFRFDVGRVVKVARLRAEREDEIEPARKGANELLQILAQLRAELVRLSHLGNTVDLVARISAVLRPKAETLAASSTAAMLMQVLDPLRAGEGKESYLLQWLRELDHYEVVPRLPARREPFARHLTEQAIALHERWLGERPPAARRHWLGKFLAALWLDLQQPVPEKTADLEYYFGKKIEDAIRKARSTPVSN